MVVMLLGLLLFAQAAQEPKVKMAQAADELRVRQYLSGHALQ